MAARPSLCPRLQLPSQHYERECLIRIRPEWLGDAYTHNVYLSFRKPLGGDEHLAEVAYDHAGRVLVHQVLAKYDTRVSDSDMAHGRTQLRPDYSLLPNGAPRDMVEIRVWMRASECCRVPGSPMWLLMGVA